ncbi:MAG: ABC transporter permease [Tissierellia bacterium]|nr:ABC transporter permease [Tissierellia bacterium]
MENRIKNYPQELFQPVTKEERDLEQIRRPSLKYWQDVVRRLRQNKLAMLGLFIIVVMAIMTVVGPRLNEFSYKDQDYAQINTPPNSTYWFGADELGRDMWTRVWVGTGYSIIIGVLAAAVDFIIGVTYGGIAGMASRRVDSILMRIAEIIYAIPYLLVVILLSVAFSDQQGASLFTLVLAMSITGWVPMAILVRGQVLQLKENEYVLAARSLGANNRYILKRHIIPNTLGPILVNVTLTIPRAIFAEATLAYMGLGLQRPLPSLGVLANDGIKVISVGIMYQLLFPALFISLIMFAFNVFGDGLRDALDPRLRK